MIKSAQFKKFPALLLVAGFVWLGFTGSLSAEDLMRGPKTRGTTTRQLNHPVSVPTWFGRNAIRIYSKAISPADGPRSPSFPTSTAYGREAIQQHGFLVGVLLIADRLIHESDVHRGPKIVKYGVSRYYDPVKVNTYWWK